MYREIMHLHPNAIGGIDFILKDEGKGAFIAHWNTEKLGAQPSAQDLAAVSESAQQAAARASLVRAYDGIVQGRLDAVARSFGYGDPNRPEVSPILHAISYADEPAVPEYQTEGQALRAWRSKTWAKAAQILAAVDAGTRTTPTEAELLAELEAAAPAPVPV